jgi:hypothetical protein
MLTPHAAAAAATASTPAPLVAVQLQQLLCIGAHARFMCGMLVENSPWMVNARDALAARLTSAVELTRLMLLPYSRQPLEIRKDSLARKRRTSGGHTNEVITISSDND